MCYDGPWTDRLTDLLAAFERKLRIHDDSFVHRLESNVDPLSTRGRALVEQILWQKLPIEGAPQIVVIEKRT